MVLLVHRSTIFISGGFKTLYISNGRCVYHERHRDTLTMTFCDYTSRSRSSGMFPSPGLSCSVFISTSRVLDTFDAVLNGHFLYYYLVTNHTDPTAMEKLVWSVIVSLPNCP